MQNNLTPIGAAARHVRDRLRAIIPHGVFGLLGVLYCMVPPALIGLWPNIFLAALYFWTIYIPEYVSFSAVLVISLLHDVYTGLPLGFHGILYGLFYTLIRVYGRNLSEKGFAHLWIFFGVFSFIIVGFGQLIMILFDRGSESFFDVQFHTLITFVTAPFIYLVINPFIRDLRS